MSTSSRISSPARRPLAAAAVLVLVLVACGDDDGASDSAGTAAVTSSDAPVTAEQRPASSEDGGTAPATEAPQATDATPATDAPQATDAGEADESSGATPDDGEVATELTTVDTDLGTVIADGGGRTLYLFLPDEQGPSTCTDACLDVWPALIGPVGAGAGTDESLIGTAARPDTGAEQATYNGWPLYYFAQDVAAGDTAGQGLNNVWYVIDPSGEAVQGG